MVTFIRQHINLLRVVSEDNCITLFDYLDIRVYPVSQDGVTELAPKKFCIQASAFDQDFLELLHWASQLGLPE